MIGRRRAYLFLCCLLVVAFGAGCGTGQQPHSSVTASRGHLPRPATWDEAEVAAQGVLTSLIAQIGPELRWAIFPETLGTGCTSPPPSKRWTADVEKRAPLPSSFDVVQAYKKLAAAPEVAGLERRSQGDRDVQTVVYAEPSSLAGNWTVDLTVNEVQGIVGLTVSSPCAEGVPPKYR